VVEGQGARDDRLASLSRDDMKAPFGTTLAMAWRNPALMTTFQHGVSGNECAVLEDAHLLGSV
jgi:hypothetical protein